LQFLNKCYTVKCYLLSQALFLSLHFPFICVLSFFVS
jgi:hypothetical protein